MADRIKNKEPILFYFSPIKNNHFINIIDTVLVLNDKNTGVLFPEQYLAIAEKSYRIEELNNLLIDKIHYYSNTHQNTMFVLHISTKFLQKSKILSIIEKFKGREQNIIIAFDKLFISFDDEKSESIKILRDNNFKIMFDDIENCPFKTILQTEYDYLRIDSRYFIENNSNAPFLIFLKDYLNKNSIILVVKNVDTTQKQLYFQESDIDFIQGKAICPPKRYFKNASLYSDTVFENE